MVVLRCLHSRGCLFTSSVMGASFLLHFGTGPSQRGCDLPWLAGLLPLFFVVDMSFLPLFGTRPSRGRGEVICWGLMMSHHSSSWSSMLLISPHGFLFLAVFLGSHHSLGMFLGFATSCCAGDFHLQLYSVLHPCQLLLWQPPRLSLSLCYNLSPLSPIHRGMPMRCMQIERHSLPLSKRTMSLLPFPS